MMKKIKGNSSNDDGLFKEISKKYGDSKKRLRQTDVRAESYDHLKFSILKSEGGFEFVKLQTAITRASGVRLRRFFF